jgi:Zn-dependent protease
LYKEAVVKWSWKVGKVVGIDLYVHVTLLLLIVWIAFSYWVAGRTLGAALTGIGFILALFGSVLLHELGHALTAARYGIRTRDITLYPIGGVARLERMPEEPARELRVAAAGPAVSLALAAVFGMLAVWSGDPEPIRSVLAGGGSFLDRLAAANLVLATFNLIPAFPMDGGRMLRALLAMRMEYTRATEIAATLGQGFAVVIGLLGLLWNPMLLFIGFFVWIGAAQESRVVQMQSVLSDIPIEGVMIREFRTLSPSDPLERAVTLMLAGWQPDFPVVESGEVTGVLRRSDLLTALARGNEHARVGDVMHRRIDRLDSFEMLEGATKHMTASGSTTLPVLHNGKLVGVLTMENIGEFMSVQAARATTRAGNGRLHTAPIHARETEQVG